MAGRILAAALDRLPDDGATVTADEISIAIHAVTRAEHKRVLNHLSDIVKSGRLLRVKNGVYRRPAGPRHPEIREVMWRVLRMRRAVSVEDLQEMAGATAAYAVEWLRMLESRDMVRCDGTTWRLLVDLVEMPADDAKAKRLRSLRAKKKAEAMKDLEAARLLIGRACRMIDELVEN